MRKMTVFVVCVLLLGSSLCFSLATESVTVLPDTAANSGNTASGSAEQSFVDLYLTVHRPNGPLELGKEVTYTIEIRNSGTKPAEDVAVSMSFSEQLEPIAVTRHKASYANGEVLFTKIPVILPKQDVALKVTAEAKSIGTAQITAKAVRRDADTKVRLEQTWATPVVAVNTMLGAKLEIELVVPDDVPRRTRGVENLIIVRNVGDADAEDITVELVCGDGTQRCSMDPPLLPGEGIEIPFLIQAGKEQKYVDCIVRVTGSNQTVEAKRRVQVRDVVQDVDDVDCVVVVASKTEDAAAVAIDSRPLTVQGKTFGQWQALVQTELDPLIRAEAIRAFALFGANGRGKDAAEAVIDAVKGIHFENLSSGDDPVEKMKREAVSAFTSGSVRIPVKDSLPVLLEKFAGDNENEQQCAYMVFLDVQKYFDAEQRTFIYDKLMHWDMKNPEDERPARLLRVLGIADEEVVLKFLRETIQKKDGIRFQWYFAGFTPLEFDEEVQVPRTTGGTERIQSMRFEGWWGSAPQVVTSVPVNPAPRAGSRASRVPSRSPITYTRDDVSFIVNPTLSPFGRSLLELLRDEGIKSDDVAIRAASQKVVEALTQITQE